jgi:hypothetical protein
MSMGQTSITLVPADGLLGMLADDGDTDKISRTANGAVYLGLGCVFGANPPAAGTPGDCQEITDAAADVKNLAGIPIWESGREPYPVANAKSQIADKGTVSLLRRGRIWVYVETAVDVTSDVYVRVTAAGADVKGQFRAGAAANFVAMSAGGFTAKFITKTTAAGLAVLELR